MYSNTAFRLEISGIYQKNTKVLNNPKGKPVHITLQYIVRIIFNYIKNTRNHIKNSTLQRASNNPNILHYRSNNMTPYLTLDNDAIKIRSKFGTRVTSETLHRN